MRYRPEIDGLRALAVVPVILFHAGYPWVSGGYVGVDVFFVISGYLITKLIYEEIRTDTFSIARFYERRIRRILPALMLVCAACIPFAWAWLLPKEFKEFGQSLVAVATFVSNIYFYNNADYFAAPTETTPLLHTWSLAVEEQFYVVFPLILVACRRASRRSLALGILVGSMISLGAAEYASRVHPTGDFYLMPTRAWELGVGALLALADGRWKSPGRFAGNSLALAGLAAVVFSMAHFTESTRHPGLISLVPVLGTAALIAFAVPGTWIGRLLSTGPLVGIGLVSYSAYLWHQPVFAFARIHEAYLTPSIYAALAAASLGLAYLSWRFVEQPFRGRSVVTRKQVFTFAWMSSASIIVLGLLAQPAASLPQRLSPEMLQAEAWSKDINPRACVAKRNKKLKPCYYGPRGPRSVVLVGDSHGEAVANALAEQLAPSGVSLVSWTMSGCPPLPGTYRVGYKCSEQNSQIHAYLESGDSPQTVVLVARWTLHINGDRFDNGEGGVEFGEPAVNIPVGAGDDFVRSPDRVERLAGIWKKSVMDLLAMGKRVVLVYPIPEVGWDVPRRLAQLMRAHPGRNEPITTSYDVFTARSRNAYVALDSIGNPPNLVRVRPAEVFCNSFMAGRCVAAINGIPLYRDDDHVNNSIGAP
jgi:peptidoglycan/LPS O-acetylase OafA/YrhL